MIRRRLSRLFVVKRGHLHRKQRNALWDKIPPARCGAKQHYRRGYFNARFR